MKNSEDKGGGKADECFLSALKYSSLFSELLSAGACEDVDSQTTVFLPYPAVYRLKPFPKLYRLRGEVTSVTVNIVHVGLHSSRQHDLRYSPGPPELDHRGLKPINDIVVFLRNLFCNKG